MLKETDNWDTLKCNGTLFQWDSWVSDFGEI